MKITGIVAEYNPFHKGHAYHIQKARELTGADYIIVVMSGNYTQRGTPALLDKHTRARMALSCGADLVLELPVYYACSSAEYFASGAVSVLNSLGCVDYLCFGSEFGTADELMQAADLLLALENDAHYQEYLREGLKEGLSFPAARSAAFSRSIALTRSASGCPDINCTHEVSDLSSASISGKIKIEDDLFRLPNNILGIEYCKAILRSGSSMKPVTVMRQGSYHDTDLNPAGNFSSASAIRQALARNSSAADLLALFTEGTDISRSVPAETLEIWQTLLKTCGPVTEQDFSRELQYCMLSLAEFDADALCTFADITPDLADKIRKHLYHFIDWDDFCLKLNSKDLTYTRISRCLAHILLNIRQESMDFCRENGFPSYARILGFRKDAAPALSAIKKAGRTSLFSSPSDALKQLSGIPRVLLQEEIKASHIYQAVLCRKYEKPFENEYQKQIVII